MQHPVPWGGSAGRDSRRAPPIADSGTTANIPAPPRRKLRVERRHAGNITPVTVRRSSYRSITSLQRDNRGCRACAEDGLPDRVAADRPAVHRPAGVPVRAGAGDSGGPGAAAVARARGQDAPPLVRHGRGHLLLHVLLRVGHALLSRPRAVRPRRPHADAARAGPLRVLAGVGVPADSAAARRHRRRARGAAPARRQEHQRVRRRPLRAGRLRRDPAAAPVRREQLAERSRQPRPVRRRGLSHQEGSWSRPDQARS